MAKISDIAKENIIAVLRNHYPESAIIDKKLYINLNIEGEKTQIAVTLTAPKVAVALESNESESGADFTWTPVKDTFNDSVKENLEKEVQEVFDFFNL